MKTKEPNEKFVGMLDYYDPTTDTIYAKKGSINYYHELGHREWFMKGIEQRLQTYMWIVLLSCVFLVGLSINKYLGLICFVPLGLLLTSEIHAWIYAIRKWKK